MPTNFHRQIVSRRESTTCPHTRAAAAIITSDSLGFIGSRALGHLKVSIVTRVAYLAYMSGIVVTIVWSPVSLVVRQRVPSVFSGVLRVGRSAVPGKRGYVR